MQAGSMIGGHGFQLFVRTPDREFRELDAMGNSNEVTLAILAGQAGDTGHGYRVMMKVE